MDIKKLGLYMNIATGQVFYTCLENNETVVYILTEHGIFLKNSESRSVSAWDWGPGGRKGLQEGTRTCAVDKYFHYLDCADSLMFMHIRYSWHTWLIVCQFHLHKT